MSKKIFPRFDTASIIDDPASIVEKIETPEKHTDSITSIAISTNNQWLVTASFDNTCVVWNFQSGDYENSFLGHSDRVTGVAFFCDNERVVSCSLDQTIHIWKVSTLKTKRMLTGHASGIQALALSADNSYLVTGSWDNTCVVWKLDTYSKLHTLCGHTGWVKGVAISSDNRYVLSGSADSTCIIWDTTSAAILAILRGHDAQVNSVVLTPDSSTAVSASSDGTLKLWKVGSGDLIGTLSGHSDAVMTVAVNPAGTHIFSGGADRSVKSWDIKSLENSRTLKGHSSTVLSVVSSSDGSLILSGGSDVCVREWSAISGTRTIRIISGDDLDEPAVEDVPGEGGSRPSKTRKGKKKKEVEDKVKPRRARRRDKEEHAVPTVETDHSFTFYTKAGLYEIKEMVNRMAARIAIIDGLSGWEQKDFVQTLLDIGEAIGEKVAHCYFKETCEVCSRFMCHVLTMIEGPAIARPSLIAPSFDLTVARLLRDMYKNGMVEAVEEMKILAQKLPEQRMPKTRKCLGRIEEDLHGEDRAAELVEEQCKKQAENFISS